MAEEKKSLAEQIVEDVPEESSASDEKSVSVAAAAAAAQGINPSAFQKQQSVAERKARKAMLKKGFEQVTGITNISVIRRKSPMFSIYAPDVYKNAGSDTWIVFGEARVDNLGRMMNPGAQRAAKAAAAATGATETGSSATPAAATKVEEVEEKVDETGVESNDIELVMAQANCSRAMAVKALKDKGNDVVNAIMELTT
ncbi:nascent polypeptide-associated complex, alpha subunit [Coemansia reversa NRRL 1564]|uniref:Nascent polypeptide-associated complex subunit alpha n=1 Tax=Coemansia reversa (strain ATCC 12441 / NRRL 1564) TaxID=763665 RepID=A0A2G5B1D6_COERN|nr:nascent polypeptide-associated complex, alpha subunit [Coemansia reversa NRRL 1564]|eukprot:PIA12819.1 nascent polypeptide-associated complex, alpha subunit [Coemansia reversa NRRL 1564]